MFMIDVDKKIKWTRFIMNFLFGAAMGVVVGFFLLGAGLLGPNWRAASAVLIVIVIAAPALVLGLVAGIFHDRFWEWIRKH
jgi:hypothetical protein